MHLLVRHHGPERRFVCSGTEQLRAVRPFISVTSSVVDALRTT